MLFIKCPIINYRKDDNNMVVKIYCALPFLRHPHSPAKFKWQGILGFVIREENHRNFLARMFYVYLRVT